MPEKIHLKIRRQEGPKSAPYWEEFEIPYRPGHNVLSALMALRENPVNTQGRRVSPPAFEANCMEEVCGACTMVINGRVRQACSTLVDSLEQPIVLEPMSKFPVLRDLMVDRSRIFNNLKKTKAWIHLDGTFDTHQGGPRISPQEWELQYAVSRCITCGACMEVCPQFGPDYPFVGAGVLAQVWLKNSHPTGKWFRSERLHAIMGEGGLTDCGNAQNCVEVCPKEIPLTTVIGKLGRQVTFQLALDLLGA